MSTIFQTQLDTPTAPQRVFSPVVDPVDNGLANAINAVSNLSKLGVTEYKSYQSNKVLKDVTSQIAKNQMAVTQGKMKIGDADLKDNAILSSAITAYPHLAPELRQAAIAVKGTDVTAELDAQARYESEQEKNRQSQNKQMFINSAAQSGFAPRKADGTFDQDKMVEFGIQEQARQYTIGLINQKNQLASDALTQQIKLKELNSVDRGTVGEREDARRTEIEKHIYRNFSAQKLDVLTNMVGEFNTEFNQGKLTPAKEQMFLDSITKGTEDAVMQLRQEVIDAGGTSSDADVFTAKFREQANNYTKLLTGDRDLSSRTLKNLNFIKNNTELDVITAIPLVTALGNAGVPLDKVTDLKDLTKMESSFRKSETLTTISTDYTGDQEDPTVSDLINPITRAIAYGKPFDSFSPKEQQGVFKAAEATLKEGLKSFDTTTPENRIGITNSLGVMVKAANDLGNSPEDIVRFSNLYNTPQMKNALAKLGKDSGTSGKLQKIADERIQYVETIFSKIGVENLNYNDSTNKTNNPVVNALLRDIETFYPYNSLKGTSFEVYKKWLLGIKDSSSTATNN